MRVLVVESHTEAGAPLRRALADRGHDVLVCHDDAQERQGCAALDASHGCPLDGAGADVAVDVRRTHHPAPRPLEQGAVCAVRKRLPLVIAGNATDSSLEQWATEVVVGDVPAVVDAVEALDGAPSPTHQRVVDEALDRLLPGEGATALVRHSRGRLQVELTLPPALPAVEAERVAVRVVAALRAFDPETTTIDVGTGERATAGAS